VKSAFAIATTNLDIESRTCLSCHDGTIASDIGRDEHQGHAVGIVLGNSAPNREMPVRSANMLDPRIRLFNGRVGCNSCHNPYSGEKSQLIMSNHGSRLCLSCHAG
jgi:predicted CXXCH cytochrome family protein